MKTEIVRIKELTKGDHAVFKNFEANFEGKTLILLKGDNGVGKSSLLQFIQIALGKQSNIPIGAKGEGEVIMNKDGKQIIFKVKFRDGKPVVQIKGDGVFIDNKKGAIAAFMGAMDFDIDAFVEMSKTDAGRKKQVEIYKSFLPFEVVDFMNTMEAKIKAVYDERTALNRDVKNLNGAIELHELINNVAELPALAAKTVNIETVYADLKKANERNGNVVKCKTGIDERTKSIADIDDEIARLVVKKEALLKEVAEGGEWLTKHPTIPTKELEEQIETATETNNKAKSAQGLIDDMKKLEDLKTNVGEMTAQIDSSKQAIKETIMQIDAPVDGLTYDEDGLYWNGIPVHPDNLSSSEIIELGIRLKMAENPDLGVLFIERGESIGAERFEIIKSLVKKNGWQLLMEQVERGKKELTIELMATDNE